MIAKTLHAGDYDGVILRQLHPFDSSVEDWSTFIERAGLFFNVNNITTLARQENKNENCRHVDPKTFSMMISYSTQGQNTEFPKVYSSVNYSSLQKCKPL